MKSSFVKKFLSLVLASVMILTLVACGSKPSDNNNNTDSTAFPTKTMTIVCPYGAGGGTDLALQILAECGKDTFGQTINVENKTGGSGTVGLTEALNAAADGYTLGTCSVDLITLPLLGLAPAGTPSRTSWLRPRRSPAPSSWPTPAWATSGTWLPSASSWKPAPASTTFPLTALLPPSPPFWAAMWTP